MVNHGVKFTADAQIIDEQEAHLVIALRVPKEVVGRNLPMFAVMANRCTEEFVGQIVMPEAAKRPPERRPARVRSAVMVALTALFVVTPPMVVPASVRTPYSFHQLTLHTPEIRPNEPLVYTTVAQKLRPCRLDFDHVLYELTDNIAIWRTRTNGVGRVVSKTPTVKKSKFALPPDLPPGPYRFSAMLSADCGGGEVYSLELPDLDFKVVN